MGTYQDLTGREFGYWTVVKYAGRYKFGGSLWECVCKCGKISLIRSRALNKKHTESCGCRVKDVGVPQRRTIVYAYRGTQLYHTYWNIKKRCENKKSDFYYCYGGRGITCEWKSFESFLEDMGSSFKTARSTYPNEKLSIERVDVNGNYCKENCIWIPQKEQTKNMRSNRKVTFRGMTMNVADWARTDMSRQLGITSRTLKDRFRWGWDETRALTTPVRKMGVKTIINLT